MRTKEVADISVGTDYFMTWQEATLPPTKRDIRETLILLTDFGIPSKQISIPAFEHLQELIRWRTGMIEKHLSKCIA